MTSQTHNTVPEQMHEELHDLCQPLTALQCRLEIGRLLAHDVAALQEVVDGSLEETRRIFEVVHRIRHLLCEEEIGEQTR